MAEQIPLSEVLAHVTDELLKADHNAYERGKSAMVFDECEVEFAVNVEKSATAGIKIWLLNLGGTGKKTDTNKIRLKFKSNPAVAIQAKAESTGAGPELKKQPDRKITPAEDS